MERSMIIEKPIPSQWYSPEEPPPPSKNPDLDYGSWIESDPVLGYKKGLGGGPEDMFVCKYIHHSDPDERGSDRWVTDCSENWWLDIGPRGITHWRYLPPPPEW